MTEALAKLAEIDDNKWQAETLDHTLKVIMEENRLSAGDVFWPTRMALSGLEKSPSPTEIMLTLDKKESLTRIQQAVDKLT